MDELVLNPRAMGVLGTQQRPLPKLPSQDLEGRRRFGRRAAVAVLAHLNARRALCDPAFLRPFRFNSRTAARPESALQAFKMEKNFVTCICIFNRATSSFWGVEMGFLPSVSALCLTQAGLGALTGICSYSILSWQQETICMFCSLSLYLRVWKADHFLGNGKWH